MAPASPLSRPLSRNVVYFDSACWITRARSREAFTVDKRPLCWTTMPAGKVINPLQFYRTMRTIPGAQARLDDVVYSQLRAWLAHTP